MPNETLVNPETKMTATPLPNVTPEQRNSALATGFRPSTISADALGAAPTTPVQIPQANPIISNPPVVTPPVGAKTDKTGNILTETPNLNSSSDTQSWIRKNLASLGVKLADSGTVQKDLEAKYDLAGRTTAAADSFNNYNQAKLALNQKLVSMRQNNPAGMSADAINSSIERASFEGNTNLANLAVIAQSAQGNLTAAESIIKSKVDAQFQPIRDQVDFLSKFATMNANDLTESQKFELQEKANKLKDQNKIVQDAASKINESLLKNNAPAGVYSSIDSIVQKYANGDIDASTAQSEMFAAASKYGSDSAAAPILKEINGVTMQWNPATGQFEPPKMAGGNTKSELTLAQSKSSIDNVTDLLGDEAIRSAVGPSMIGRFIGRGLDSATGARQNFIAGVEQLRSNLNLESLINAKARGATFGALSDQELQVLSNAASKIGSWAIKDKEGQVTGYNASEKDFKRELDKISNFAKLDYIIRGGDAEDVGAKLQSDGTVWAYNSDGTYTQIR